jgi:hypothetical protein
MARRGGCSTVNWLKPLGWVLLGAVVGSGAAFAVLHHQRRIEFNTPIQAVLLDSGQVYFGHLTGLGQDYPVVTDVYYVQSVTNPQTREVSNMLVRRGKEWHSPDRMYLNARHIVVVEPVGANSKVAQLIAESQQK